MKNLYRNNLKKIGLFEWFLDINRLMSIEKKCFYIYKIRFGSIQLIFDNFLEKKVTASNFKTIKNK